MVRKDKKNRKCICCNKTFATSQKLRQHYKSNKNQCRLVPDDIPKQASTPETFSQKEKPKVINQTPDSEAGPSPSTQAYREGLIGEKEPSEVEWQDTQEYTKGKHFRSIYEEAKGIYKEEEPPNDDIIFLERKRETERQHSSLNYMTVWKGGYSIM